MPKETDRYLITVFQTKLFSGRTGLMNYDADGPSDFFLCANNVISTPIA